MSNKEFISNLSSTYADVRRLDVKKINLKGKNILEYIEESVPTIKHSKDTRETVYEYDLWGQWVETKDDGTIIIHDDYLTNPNAFSAYFDNVKAVQDNKAYSEITTDSDDKFTGVVESSVIANIQTEMIKDGSNMFYDTPLESFNGDLSSLVNGENMFNGTSLTSFTGDLSSLVNGSHMFYSTYLESFNSDLSSLVDGRYMFIYNPLTSFSSDLSSLVYGENMLSYTSLTSFSSDLSSLVDGYCMFYSSLLKSFSSDLSGLVNGYQMFYNSTLESFSGDLSSLTNGSGMFYMTSLTSFNSDLSSLVNGYEMFHSCKLTSFTGDLISLVDGYYMFQGCTSLTSFNGDLSSLVNGRYMFRYCKLTPQSVMYIVESIKNLIEEKAKYPNSETGEPGEIPWVTYDSTTRKYSAPFGFMENGSYVYTYNNPNTHTTTTNVGQLTLGINVTNNSDTIEQQLQIFAEDCLYDSWTELKQEFVNKGWTVAFQYGGTNTEITLSEDEQFRGVPVYARLIEEENKDEAEYCTEDGTKFYNIDWGHDVTDYDSYQYFGSLLEACGYFGIIPVKYLEEN